MGGWGTGKATRMSALPPYSTYRTDSKVSQCSVWSRKSRDFRVGAFPEALWRLGNRSRSVKLLWIDFLRVCKGPRHSMPRYHGLWACLGALNAVGRRGRSATYCTVCPSVRISRFHPKNPNLGYSRYILCSLTSFHLLSLSLSYCYSK